MRQEALQIGPEALQLATSTWGRVCIDFGGLVESFGRVHVLVVHFPIALLLIAAGLELWARRGPSAAETDEASDSVQALWRSPTAGVCLLIATVAAIAASGTGWVHSGFVYSAEPRFETLWLHRWLGVSLAGLCVLTLLVGLLTRAGHRSSWVFTGLLLLAAGVVMPVGHFGGELVHGKGFLTKAFESGPARERRADSPAEPVAAEVEVPVPEAEPDREWIESRLAELRGRGTHAAWVSQKEELVEVGFGLLERPITDQDLALLEGLELVLVSLNLTNCDIAVERMRTVAACSRLERLYLQQSTVTDEGLALIAPLARLEFLNLHSTEIGDDAITTLAGLESLRRVILWNTRVTQEGLQRLQQARAGLQIQSDL